MKSKIKTQKKVQKQIKTSEKFQKVYFLIPVLNVLATLWSSVILVCIPQFFIKNDKLTWYAIIITIALIVPSAFLSLVKSYYEELFKSNTDVTLYRKSEALYKELIRSFYNIVTRKAKRLSKSISNDDGQIYANPSEQISDIFEEMQNCLSFLLTNKNNRIDKDDIYINLLYKINDSTEWFLLEPNQQGLSYELLMTEKSFFTFLLNHKNNYLFHNSKQELLEIERYIEDERDVKEDGKLKGSIIGYKFNPIKVKGHNITALLFFSTFSTRFVEPKKENDDISATCETVKKNIKNIIIGQFVPRIQIELCHEYILKTRENISNSNVETDIQN